MRRYILMGALCVSLMLGLAYDSPLTRPLWRLSFVPQAAAQKGGGNSSATLAASPTSLAFDYQQGGALPPSQQLSVTSSRSTKFSAATSGGSWLSITPTSGSTPAAITVSVRPGTMAAGTYNASVTVSSRAGSVTVPVTLKITSATATLQVSPGSLAFGYQQGGTTPSSQTLSVTSSTGSAMSFNDSKSSASWLSLSRTSGTTPSSIIVSVSPGSLSVGTYNASITVTASTNTVNVPVTLTVTSSTSGGGSSGSYVLLAWSELGMHCMDGKDYSVASVLPPYNTIYAKLLTTGNTPTPVDNSTGVTITYQAMKDAAGSINTTSSGTSTIASKTNFWTYVKQLFLAQPAPDVGLPNKPVQSLTPQPMDYDSSKQLWEAAGVPTAPYDDSGASNAYPMGQLVAKDASGKTLATATVVFNVSDEMSCKNCHTSPNTVTALKQGGTNSAAMPSTGWANYTSDLAKDVKLNILKKHDSDHPLSQTVLSAAQAKGWYQGYSSSTPSLYDIAWNGGQLNRPVLCASCHLSNALNAAGMNTGVTGVPALTVSMHSQHSSVTMPGSTTTLNNMTSPSNVGCYQCHPGTTTKCQRGAMTGTIPGSTAETCYSCHGNLTAVGNATRTGWLSEPNCQMCHQNGTTYTTVQPVTTSTDQTFATNNDVPATGFSLYRFSKGHGSTECSACHGAQHAEYPTDQPNDQVYSTHLQGYAGRITECTVCHSTALATTNNGGPHGMHTVGQAWISAHPNYASSGRYTACAYCHGSDYRGTRLSMVLTNKTFSAGEYGTKSFSAYHQVSCYDCHNGPTGG